MLPQTSISIPYLSPSLFVLISASHPSSFRKLPPQICCSSFSDLAPSKIHGQKQIAVFRLFNRITSAPLMGREICAPSFSTTILFFLHWFPRSSMPSLLSSASSHSICIPSVIPSLFSCCIVSCISGITLFLSRYWIRIPEKS